MSLWVKVTLIEWYSISQFLYFISNNLTLSTNANLIDFLHLFFNKLYWSDYIYRHKRLSQFVWMSLSVYLTVSSFIIIIIFYCGTRLFNDNTNRLISIFNRPLYTFHTSSSQIFRPIPFVNPIYSTNGLCNVIVLL